MPLRRAEPRAFASLLIAERRLSIVEIAAQLGHHLTVCLDIYGT